MRINVSSKGDFKNALAWMDKVSNGKASLVKKVANYGDSSLRDATPEDTGETANGWDHKITANQKYLEVSWVNNAHPESAVNVASLIELGHGTGTGGYVPPRPYIKQAMAPVWSKLDNDIKELMK